MTITSRTVEPGIVAVTVDFPRVNFAASAEAPRSAAAPARGSETILLVEDDDLVRELSTRILEMHGYRVLRAEARETASATVFSLPRAPRRGFRTPLPSSAFLLRRPGLVRPV